MDDSGPLTKEIAASVEDVKALLEDNRSLSVAILARRLRDHEADTRNHFREVNAAMASLKAAVVKLEHRMEQAALKFKEMREDVDKSNGNSASPPRRSQPMNGN